MSQSDFATFFFAFLRVLCVLRGSVYLVDAPKPEIKYVSVLGVRAGRTTTVTIYGENLAPTGVTVKPSTVKAVLGVVKATDEKEKKRGGKLVEVALTVPANAPPDIAELTLTGPDKVSVTAKVALVADAPDSIAVKKPIETFGQAQAIAGTAFAVEESLGNNTADVYRLDAKTGETWEITLLSGRVGSPLDGIVRVRDARHNCLALSAGDKKRDRHLLFRAPHDGPFYVEVTEAESRGGPEYRYRLTVTRKP